MLLKDKFSEISKAIKSKENKIKKLEVEISDLKDQRRDSCLELGREFIEFMGGVIEDVNDQPMTLEQYDEHVAKGYFFNVKHGYYDTEFYIEMSDRVGHNRVLIRLATASLGNQQEKIKSFQEQKDIIDRLENGFREAKLRQLEQLKKELGVE